MVIGSRENLEFCLGVGVFIVLIENEKIIYRFIEKVIKWEFSIIDWYFRSFKMGDLFSIVRRGKGLIMVAWEISFIVV